MHFYIATPSFNQLDYLKRCVASVRDQVGALATPALTVHHHIQDGGSTDGTPDWLRQHARDSATTTGYCFTFASAPDQGMYDALNMAMPRLLEQAPATGVPHAAMAWLNCDEQYLPNALAAVAEAWHRRPATRLLTGDYLIVNPAGDLLAFRKTTRARAMFIQASHLYTLSCATFFHPDVWTQAGPFDAGLKAAADEAFVLRALRHRPVTRHLRRYLAAFTFSPDILSRSARALHEHRQQRLQAPRVTRLCAPAINLLRHIEKTCAGGYRQAFPLAYALCDENGRRVTRLAQSAPFTWPTSS